MTDITTEQHAAAIEVPAFYVTQTLVSYGPDGVRLSFGEESNTGKGAIRTAVFMSKDNLKGLGALIATVLGQMDAKPELKEVEKEIHDADTNALPLAAVNQ